MYLIHTFKMIIQKIRYFSIKSLFGFKGAKKSSTPTTVQNTEKRPHPNQINSRNAVFDQVTHTGQAWDQSDYRLARFTFSEKQVNPNIAAHLIAQKPPIASEERVVSCDGGHPALGHPRVYINLDKPGTHACGYCGVS